MLCHSPQLAPLPTNSAITSAGLVTCSSKLPWERCLTHWSQEQHQFHVFPHPGALHPAPRTPSCCFTAVPHIPVPGTCWVCAGELSSTSLQHPYSAKFDTSSKGCTANLPAVLLKTCVNCCTVPRAPFTEGGMQINCILSTDGSPFLVPAHTILQLLPDLLPLSQCAQRVPITRERFS